MKGFADWSAGILACNVAKRRRMMMILSVSNFSGFALVQARMPALQSGSL